MRHKYLSKIYNYVTITRKIVKKMKQHNITALSAREPLFTKTTFEHRSIIFSAVSLVKVINEIVNKSNTRY